VVALLAAAALAACGGKGSSPTSSASSLSAQAAAARRALCHDLRQFGGGAFRVPNLERVLPKLKADARQLDRAGDARAAAAVRKLEAATRKLIAALKGQGGVSAANQGMLHALGSVPSC
jgi:hypothetical protein